MNALAAIILGVIGFIFFSMAAVAALALFALLTMALWALVFVLLAWLMPETAAIAREAANLAGYTYWQIGAGVGFVLFLLRRAFSHTITSKVTSS